jgi:isochorismate hydrolase
MNSLTMQLHYAALDAAVLLPIYNSIACNVNPSSAKMTDLKKFMVC